MTTTYNCQEIIFNVNPNLKFQKMTSKRKSGQNVKIT